MNEPLASLDGDFASPQSCLVEVTETIHHNWYGKSDGEDTKESANATDKLAKSRDGRGGAIAHCGDGEQSPPETINKGPILLVFLAKVNQARKGQNGNADQHDEQSQLLVCLFQGGKEWL